MEPNRNRICIAILALGGQGGGVLADWIQSLGRAHGWLAQGTSVPGVAQRTGSTVYYVELARRDGTRTPIMAQMPVPGDVDIVIASELMEAGRAMLRGFVDKERTILIGSTHRIYAISEKAAMGDGRGDGAAVLAATERHARRFVGFDMEAATERSQSVISSVMFGALAASEALPFERGAFEQAIRASGVAVESNLRGFAEGFLAARVGIPAAVPEEPAPPHATTAAGERLQHRIRQALPAAARRNALHGVQRLMDYQDEAYAMLYLDRLVKIAASDGEPWEITAETARHLALWMSYEDMARVSDLKIRASRIHRVSREVQSGESQLLAVTEFMHPRLQEVCDILPSRLGRAILRSAFLRRRLAPFFRSGRHVETTRLRWFLLLRLMAGLRRVRPRSLRYGEEQHRIEAWLDRIRAALPADPAFALELVRCQRLIKGYGDTFDRGWSNFQRLMTVSEHLRDEPALALQRLRELALADDKGEALAAALETIDG